MPDKNDDDARARRILSTKGDRGGRPVDAEKKEEDVSRERAALLAERRRQLDEWDAIQAQRKDNELSDDEFLLQSLRDRESEVVSRLEQVQRALEGL